MQLLASVSDKQNTAGGEAKATRLAFVSIITILIVINIINILIVEYSSIWMVLNFVHLVNEIDSELFSKNP